MKQLIFSLAFMLIGLFAFANTGSNEISSKLLATKIEIVEDKVAEKNKAAECIHVSLSCGVEYDICKFKGTLTQLINSVLNSNNNVCGTHFNML
ncbi:MAG: hypothetical protein QM541_04880 [Flavobacterium sp.]|nr:hypothetical protein [Flavobacterium sp.]